MDIIEGLCEFPDALFRKFFTAPKKSFDEILKDHAKNKLIGLCILLILTLVILLTIFLV